MRKLQIVRASEKDIPAIEGLLLKKVKDLKKRGIVQWREEEVTWNVLSQTFSPNEFYLAYQNGVLSGCFAAADEDRLFWPEIPKGDSLFLHKLTVDDRITGTGAGAQMLSFFKQLGRKRKLLDVRLDVRADKPKLISFYERNGFLRTGEAQVLADTASYLYVCRL